MRNLWPILLIPILFVGLLLFSNDPKKKPLDNWPPAVQAASEDWWRDSNSPLSASVREFRIAHGLPTERTTGVPGTAGR